MAFTYFTSNSIICNQNFSAYDDERANRAGLNKIPGRDRSYISIKKNNCVAMLA